MPNKPARRRARRHPLKCLKCKSTEFGISHIEKSFYVKYAILVCVGCGDRLKRVLEEASC